MNKKFGVRRYVFLEQTPGVAGGGAAAAAGTAAGGEGGAAGGAATTQPGGAAGAGAEGSSGSAAPGTGSALSTAGAAEWSLQSVPEKYRVVGADGEIDVSATLRKADEARASLEKRMGEGGVRPKTADEYKLPENDTFKNLQLDDKLTAAFKAKAHGWGLSQPQYEAVMTEWATMAPELVQAGHKESVESTLTTLRGVFKEDFDTNMRGALRAISTVSEKAGIDFAEVEAAIGNNPVAIRLFAQLSKEMGEDSTPAAAAGATGGAASSHQYMTENFAAYSDAKHPQHKAVTARYQALSARESKGADPL